MQGILLQEQNSGWETLTPAGFEYTNLATVPTADAVGIENLFVKFSPENDVDMTSIDSGLGLLTGL
jgi:hypothetical protein